MQIPDFQIEFSIRQKSTTPLHRVNWKPATSAESKRPRPAFCGIGPVESVGVQSSTEGPQTAAVSTRDQVGHNCGKNYSVAAPPKSLPSGCYRW